MSSRGEVPLSWHDVEDHDVADRYQPELTDVDGERGDRLRRWADRSADTADPWLPQTNHTDPSNRYTATDRPAQRPLTRRDGTKIRADAADGHGERAVAATWGEVTRRWADWIDGYDDAAAFFDVEGDDGETETRKIDLGNRFSEEYCRRYYAKMKALERGVLEDFNDPHTIMLPALTGSSRNAERGPRCPVDFLNDLLASWEPVRSAMHRVLEDREWVYVRIPEPHPGDGPNQGYPHYHLAVIVDGPVDADVLARRVVDAHVRNSPVAEREAHDPGDVNVERVTERERAPEGSDDPEDGDGGVTNLGAYLTEYFGSTYGEDPTEEPEYVRRFYALMWATGRQRFTCSNDAQQYMKPPEEDGEEPADVRFLGVSWNGDPADAVAPEDGAGGVDVIRAVGLDASVDPPPD